MNRYLVLLAALLWLPLTSAAQQYPFVTYDVEDGLPRSGVYALLEDHLGYLWAATEGGGVARFDGREFTVFNQGNGLAGNTVRSLYEDREGRIWMGTQGQGVSVFDRHSFNTFTSIDGLSGNYVRAITQDTLGRIWLGTSGGGATCIHWESEQPVFTRYTMENGLPHNRVRALLTDSRGRTWLGTDEGLVQALGDSLSEAIDTLFDHPRVLDLYEDQEGHIWVGTQKGVTRLNGETLVKMPGTEVFTGQRIRAISQDQSGHFWLGTKQGVYEWDGTYLHKYTEPNGLSNNRIREIISDSEGDIWLGTYFGGICRFSGHAFVHFKEEQGLPNDQVLSIAALANGDLVAGTLDGAARLSGFGDVAQASIRMEQIPELAHHEVYDVLELKRDDKTELWFGTDDGIMGLTHSGVEKIGASEGLGNQIVYSLCTDLHGQLWAGTADGISRITFPEEGIDEPKIVHYTTEDGLAGYEARSLYVDAGGRVWVGFADGYISVFDNGKWSRPTDSPDPFQVTDIASPDGKEIWISTASTGLFRYRDGQKSYDRMTVENGLSSNSANFLLFETQGQFWVGTEKGLDFFDKTQEDTTYNIRHFGIQQGFTGLETMVGSCVRDIYGNRWFGTIRGLTGFEAPTISDPARPPVVHLIGVRSGFEPMNWTTSDFAKGTEGPFRLPKELVLPYISNRINFDFQGISLRNPGEITFRWKLENFEDNWNTASGLNEVSYTNLPAGDYTFYITAAGPDGNWSEAGPGFRFTVLPPFWRTWWFITICVLLALGLVRLWTKLRERRLLRTQRILQKKVDIRTAEVVRQKEELASEKKKSDSLLLNILPFETAEELKTKGKAQVKHYDLVSVLFTDFVGFTKITEKISHQELVDRLDRAFRQFDEVMEGYDLEKIKTIGDAYMCAGGIPVADETNPLRTVLAGLEMQRVMAAINAEEPEGAPLWKLRIGVDSGHVTTGVVGKKKFAYDLWGDTVNTAARMESSSEPGKVNISGATYEQVKSYFECTHRGKLPAKNKGEIDMYFVDRLLPEWSADADGWQPNAALLQQLNLKASPEPATA